MNFKLEKSDYIELNSLLKVAGLCESGGRANQLITSGEVLVNGECESRKRYKVRRGDVINCCDERIVVE